MSKKKKLPKSKGDRTADSRAREILSKNAEDTICSHCKGSGILYGSYEADCSPADCPHCEGSGRRR